MAQMHQIQPHVPSLDSGSLA